MVEETERQAVICFSNSRMEVVGPGHWFLTRDDGFYWCHVVVMGNCAITVWGDIDACTFAYCSGAKKPEDVVRWIAGADINYYGRQKASIGMSGIGVDDHHHGVAIRDLYQQLYDVREEYDEDRWKKIEPVYTEAVENAVSLLSHGDDVIDVQKSFYDDISDIDQDAWEWVYEIGRVPSVRLIYAMVAIRRLGELLESQDV